MSGVIPVKIVADGAPATGGHTAPVGIWFGRNHTFVIVQASDFGRTAGLVPMTQATYDALTT
jgi:hypothetical protein